MKRLLMMSTAIATLNIRAFNNSDIGTDDNPIPDRDGVVMIDTDNGPVRINHSDFKRGEHKLYRGDRSFLNEPQQPTSHVTPVPPPSYPPATQQQPQSNIPSLPSQMGMAAAPAIGEQVSQPSAVAPGAAANISTTPPADDAGDDQPDDITPEQAARIQTINFGVLPAARRFYVIDINAGNAPVVDMPELLDVAGYKSNKAAWEAIQALKKRVGVA